MIRDALVSFRNNKSSKICKHILFFIAYILYFSSWVFGDLAAEYSWLLMLGKVMRCVSYPLMLACLLLIQRDKKDWIAFLLMEAVGLYYFIESKELYVMSLVLLIMVSLDEDIINIFKVSLAILCVTVITTLALCATGVLENVVTARGPYDPDPRYSMGFYHSNVLPLLLFYIIAYLGVIRDLTLNKWILLALAVATGIVYVVCDSRISLLMTLALIVLFAVYPRLHIKPTAQNMIYGICRRTILILSVVSIVLILLLPMGSKIVNILNIGLSDRITLGYQKALNYGIHFLSPISIADYIADGIVVDNAYISTVIRYGWFSVAMLSAVNYYCCEKFKKCSGPLLIFIGVSLVNFVDNDLLTYSCFPFLLAAFNKKMLHKAAYGRQDTKDLVSVIMSTYNEDAEQLSTSIESILKQSYNNIEFIIINDNPKNEQLRAVLGKYAQMDKRIVLVENEENMGLVNSLNRALSYARGSFIARMDADDIARPDRIMLQMSYLKNNGMDFVGGCIHYIDEENHSLRHTLKVPAMHEQICRAIRWGNCLPHPTWIVKKEVYETLGGYRLIPHAEDYDFILRALNAGYQLGNVPCTVLDYRVRTTGISVSNRVEQNMIRNYLAANRQGVFKITEEMVDRERTNQRNPYYLYDTKKNEAKTAVKDKNVLKTCVLMCRLITDKYFWFWLVEKARFYIYR